MTVVEPLSDASLVNAHALFLGQHIDLSALIAIDKPRKITNAPLLLKAGDKGTAILFDYGAVVLFGLSPIEEAKFLADLQAFVSEPFAQPESETATLQQCSSQPGKVENGKILLADLNAPQFRIIADVLAKSVILAQYEMEAAQVFSQIEPFAISLQKPRWQQRKQGNELLRQIGNSLLIQNKLVGQAAIIDKPELLWEYPEFERLYLRLEDEYEIRERHLALEKKFDLVSRTVETALELQQQTTSLRLEWYIVILIVLELLVSLYELFTKG
jgi:uncharacterized Rmd1/YagE family protein